MIPHYFELFEPQARGVIVEPGQLVLTGALLPIDRIAAQQHEGRLVDDAADRRRIGTAGQIIHLVDDTTAQVAARRPLIIPVVCVRPDEKGQVHVFSSLF